MTPRETPPEDEADEDFDTDFSDPADAEREAFEAEMAELFPEDPAEDDDQPEMSVADRYADDEDYDISYAKYDRDKYEPKEEDADEE